MTQENSGWVRFWNKGTWWKALILVALYWVAYQLLGLGVGALFGAAINKDNPLADPLTVLLGLALPVILAGGLLLIFVRSVGWTSRIFGRQPLQPRPWMWVAVVLVVVPIVMRLAATNWSAYSSTLILTILLFGLCVGFTEELATRGIAVTMLRGGGHGERSVFILSSLYFALLHSGNALSGQAPVVVAVTVVYTFGFGAMMYLSLRVTGRLVWAILLHAATDPTTFLATGGIDAHSDTGGAEGLISLAGIFNGVYVLLALVAIFLVKDRVGRSPLPHHSRVLAD